MLWQHAGVPMTLVLLKCNIWSKSYRALAAILSLRGYICLRKVGFENDKYNIFGCWQKRVPGDEQFVHGTACISPICSTSVQLLAALFAAIGNEGPEEMREACCNKSPHATHMHMFDAGTGTFQLHLVQGVDSSCGRGHRRS